MVSHFIVVFHVVRLLARSQAGRPRSNETAETTHVSGRCGFFFGGGGEQDATPAGPRNHLKTRPKMTRATIWPTSAQNLRFGGGGFVTKTPEKSRFEGGARFFGEGAPMFPRAGAPKGRSRCGVASRFGVYVLDTTFRRGNASTFRCCNRS